ncbi:hypothetical protein D3Y57_05515 [Sphingomonas paeninsulae]|uniref:Portal protein n=1 Tax=Sphingomonas paeninsulae TaxID=2319844 RepID=A0A494TJG0_SPHPE|nr:hypothetical protein [Sphingomonas paeninsulae]AYJ85538.1 hypothetical protein D3Y57_05515 [Sphingomonas paeninsulae]
MTKLTDSEILSLLSSGVKAGVRFSDTKLSRERQRVLDYYHGKLPAPSHAGNSKYVSTDVYEAVESMKSTLLETFSASSGIVSFGAHGAEDVELAKQATAYCQHVVFEQNKGTELFSDIIHDGLTARVGVAKVHWDKCVEEIEETFEDQTQDEVAALLEDDEVKLTSLAVDHDDPNLASGTLTRSEDKSQVRITILPPEEFIVDPNIKCIEEATILTHRTEKNRTELLKEGYKKSLVRQLSTSNTLETDRERISRMEPFSSDTFGTGRQALQDATDVFEIMETYAYLDMGDSGNASYWRIVHCGSVILEKEQVDRHPFKTFVPLATPHTFYGNNFAARVIPTQNSKTVLTRSILDHAVVANNPRYGIVKGALTNPRELLDNRIGGLVNVTRPDGIFALPQAPLNPFVFQTIAMLDDHKEQVTGVSKLSQGLNKDAVSSQNSEGLVEQLVSAAMQRQKTCARSFAVQFLGPLFLEVYRLVIENEAKDKIIEINGSFTPCTPSAWRRQRSVTIDLRLGYGEKDRLATEYIQIGQVLAADPAIAHLYGPEQRYNLYKKVLETKGHKNVSEFLADPKQVQPPGMDPMVKAELDIKVQEVAINERKQSTAEKKVSDHAAIEQMNADLKTRITMLEYALKVSAEERKDAEVTNRIEVSQDELELARIAEAKAPQRTQRPTRSYRPTANIRDYNHRLRTRDRATGVGCCQPPSTP